MGLGFASSITPALADADDAAWIKKCVGDNKREGATPKVVAAWCSCMNNKMSSEERKVLVRSRHKRKTPPSSTRPHAPVSAAGARPACSAAPPVAGARRIRAFAMSRSETVGSRTIAPTPATRVADCFTYPRKPHHSEGGSDA
jgi:hypothetical protein